MLQLHQSDVQIVPYVFGHEMRVEAMVRISHLTFISGREGRYARDAISPQKRQRHLEAAHGLFWWWCFLTSLLFHNRRRWRRRHLACSYARTDDDHLQLVRELSFLICTFDFVLEHLFRRVGRVITQAVPQIQSAARFVAGVPAS